VLLAKDEKGKVGGLQLTRNSWPYSPLLDELEALKRCFTTYVGKELDLPVPYPLIAFKNIVAGSVF
jgi:hypothetical protein